MVVGGGGGGRTSLQQEARPETKSKVFSIYSHISNLKFLAPVVN